MKLSWNWSTMTWLTDNGMERGTRILELCRTMEWNMERLPIYKTWNELWNVLAMGFILIYEFVSWKYKTELSWVENFWDLGRETVLTVKRSHRKDGSTVVPTSILLINKMYKAPDRLRQYRTDPVGIYAFVKEFGVYGLVIAELIKCEFNLVLVIKLTSIQLHTRKAWLWLLIFVINGYG